MRGIHRQHAHNTRCWGGAFIRHYPGGAKPWRTRKYGGCGRRAGRRPGASRGGVLGRTAWLGGAPRRRRRGAVPAAGRGASMVPAEPSARRQRVDDAEGAVDWIGCLVCCGSGHVRNQKTPIRHFCVAPSLPASLPQSRAAGRIVPTSSVKSVSYALPRGQPGSRTGSRAAESIDTVWCPRRPPSGARAVLEARAARMGYRVECPTTIEPHPLFSLQGREPCPICLDDLSPRPGRRAAVQRQARLPCEVSQGGRDAQIRTPHAQPAGRSSYPRSSTRRTTPRGAAGSSRRRRSRPSRRGCPHRATPVRSRASNDSRRSTARRGPSRRPSAPSTSPRRPCCGPSRTRTASAAAWSARRSRRPPAKTCRSVPGRSSCEPSLALPAHPRIFPCAPHRKFTP